MSPTARREEGAMLGYVKDIRYCQTSYPNYITIVLLTHFHFADSPISSVKRLSTLSPIY